MPVLQKSKTIYPFWGEPVNMITGLDPLSLQTTSEATYATLLPGITNLTNRLRYYGFYCWLLDFYFKRETKGNSAEQYKFIRRAELMVAILMQSERKEILQITGSNFASNLIASISGDYYDLAAGADQNRADPDKKVYWQYPSGAFGQYYFGALRAMALVVATENKSRDIIYNVTPPHPRQKVSGRQLAEAFDASIPETVKDAFYRNIKSGRLAVEDIAVLMPFFAIDKVDPGTPEWPLYVAMLLDKDDPAREMEEHYSYHRRETIRQLIRLAVLDNGNYYWYPLLLEAYRSKLSPEDSVSADTMVGWYAYQFNEYFQYACGAIFWGMLQYLYERQQDQYLPSFVQQLAQLVVTAICEELPQLNPSDKIHHVLEVIKGYSDEERLYDSIETKHDSNPIAASTTGFLLLFTLYNSNKEQLLPLKEYINRQQMIREGNMVDGLLSMHSTLNDNLSEFIEQFLLRKIIFRHQLVAIRKMGSGTQSTHKFMIEDQYLRFIDTFPPKNTSPRMDALYNLLVDLQVIGAENQITPLHQNLLAD